MVDPLEIPGMKDVRMLLKKHHSKEYGYRPIKSVTYIAIHHSLTKSGSAEAFARYHVATNNWPGLGYHFVIEKDGIMKWCNEIEKSTYHVGNSNRFSVGICLTGDFRTEKPTDLQWKSLNTLTKWLMRELSIEPENVFGHSEFSGYASKQCPCLDMDKIRLSLKEKKQPSNKPFNFAKYYPNPTGKIYRLSELFSKINHLSPPELKKINPQLTSEATTKPPDVQIQPSPEAPISQEVSSEISTYIRMMEKEGYSINYDDSKDYNLNILGLRTPNHIPNKFDDSLVVFWKFNGTWHIKKYKITTDPGTGPLLNLNKKGNSNGTAILKKGQYKDSHIIGYHKKQYRALVQANPVTVIRDNNWDNILDFDNGREFTGIFGINIHRANEHRESQQVDAWSAGCQVFANPQDFKEFMDMCTKSNLEWRKNFTYSLINV
ncbi:Negative regulator of beta-lactamase expression [Aquiflexum balticum DSM 16537]|uniref:Negative regulator of beta-lactamase expression n=1 Tax=Aquiflexum balticum DSM 16537 TaxID=758820 RepID=A0A1W2H7Q8_9BACT|nr:peptidoglycan recognition family protein [Aquiflexum balticum]SMD44566.1 Negative regulator of beta-lactamase expression [Aquiflexum balticum DSM 16537]